MIKGNFLPLFYKLKPLDTVVVDRTIRKLPGFSVQVSAEKVFIPSVTSRNGRSPPGNGSAITLICPGYQTIDGDLINAMADAILPQYTQDRLPVRDPAGICYMNVGRHGVLADRDVKAFLLYRDPTCFFCFHIDIFFEQKPAAVHFFGRIHQAAIPAYVQFVFQTDADFLHLGVRVQRIGIEGHVDTMFQTEPDLSHLTP